WRRRAVRRIQPSSLDGACVEYRPEAAEARALGVCGDVSLDVLSAIRGRENCGTHAACKLASAAVSRQAREDVGLDDCRVTARCVFDAGCTVRRRRLARA